MNMTKTNRVVEKGDLKDPDVYAKNRKKFRKELVEYKKNRRVPLGPYATFYFESYETMLGQIQEMIHIEKGGDKQLSDELTAYNPLIPKGNELVATLMFEIDDPILRSDFLSKVGGIDERVYLQIADEKVKAVSEMDVDRTSAEGKASSVQFVHFNLSEEQIKKFKNVENLVSIYIDHKLYNHKVDVSIETKKTLIKDFI